jgi:type IV secretory pathway TraG/TraD family ATPase VirD4
MSKKINPIVIYDKKDEISNVSNPLSALRNPGDALSARITDTNRKVVKLVTDEGKSKYSATQYPNGTIVETKTIKKK